MKTVKYQCCRQNLGMNSFKWTIEKFFKMSLLTNKISLKLHALSVSAVNWSIPSRCFRRKKETLLTTRFSMVTFLKIKFGPSVSENVLKLSPRCHRTIFFVQNFKSPHSTLFLFQIKKLLFKFDRVCVGCIKTIKLNAKRIFVKLQKKDRIIGF